MPTLSVFIRKDDVHKWKALEHKSEWIHNNLNSVFGSLADLAKKPIIKKPEDVLSVINTNGIPLNKLCKIHSTPLDNRGRCLQKGCKYAK